jgi:dihydrofolate synthase/folylpolyglutamate synthase
MFSYEEALQYIHGAEKLGIKPGLKRVEAVLGQLGNPERELRFAHIAGTNGKGSTTATIASIMQAAGYKTGLFISPYLERFEERMQIDGELITPDELAFCVSEVRDAAERAGVIPSEFEIVTATAMLYYKRAGCDIVSLEVGLGGRFDATNVIPCPDVAVITSISLDHTKILGDTVEKIAFEKCGIIKQDGRVVLYPEQPGGVTEVVRKRAAEEGARLIIPYAAGILPGAETLDGSDFHYRGLALHTPLIGEHQLLNVSTAVEAAFVLRARGFDLPDEAIVKGVRETKFPGRFEVMRRDPVVVLDGGHNPDGVRVLRKAALQHLRTRPGRLILVMGMLADKDYKQAIPMMAAIADVFIAAPPASPRALATAEIAKTAEICPDVREAQSIPQAVDMALSEAKPADSVLICGSLYLIGEARTYIRGNILTK